MRGYTGYKLMGEVMKQHRHSSNLLSRITRWLAPLVLTYFTVRAAIRQPENKTQTVPKDDTLTWDDPKTDVNAPWLSVALSIGIPAALIVVLSIRTLGSAVDPSIFSVKTLGHALSGLPVLVTAVGALCVAIALISRSYEQPAEATLAGAETRLANRIRNRPTLSRAEATRDPSLTLSVPKRWVEVEGIEIKSVKKAKKSLARRRSIARSLELSGSLVLLFGALLGAWAWMVGL